MTGWEAIENGDGLTLMLVGMSVVFTSLLFLMVLMSAIKGVFFLRYSRTAKKSEVSEDQLVTKAGIAGVDIAAIALTLILEEEQMHDDESMVLTLRALPRPYSNWWMRELDGAWRPKSARARKRVMQATDPIMGKKI